MFNRDNFMITPLQQASGIAVTDIMRSMVTAIEERQQEEHDKANGVKKDDITRPQVERSETHRAANEKITAHLFGSMKRDADPYATLIARFSSALNIEQGKDESSFAFAKRLSDAVVLTDKFEKTDALGKPVKLELADLGVSSVDVINVMEHGSTPKTNPMAGLAARLAEGVGLTGGEEDFGIVMTSVLTATRAGLPKDVKTLEEMTGLKDLGFSASQMIAAIANPWGPEALSIKGVLKKQTDDANAMTIETQKVIQRLEDVADPKSKEELEAERGTDKIGEVNDAEVKAEREQDIQNADAGEKLEDVQDLQDVVKDNLDSGSIEQPADGAPVIDAELAMIQVLAAIPGETEASNDNDGGSAGEPAAIEKSTETAVVDDSETLLNVQAVVQEGQKDILPISVDDNGLYALLLKKAA
jgi:hypothetical protein